MKLALLLDDFASSPLPRDVNAYREYRRNSIEFIVARNSRRLARPPKPHDGVAGKTIQRCQRCAAVTAVRRPQGVTRHRLRSTAFYAAAGSCTGLALL